MNQPPDPGMALPGLQSSPPGDAPPPYQGYGVPAPPPGMYYDTESGLTLPQGVQLAGQGRRIGAYFLAIALVFATLGIGYAIWGLILWPRGQTPALQVLGMRCWRPETGRVPGFWRTALREIIGRGLESLLGATLLASFILFWSRGSGRRCTTMLRARWCCMTRTRSWTPGAGYRPAIVRHRRWRADGMA